MSDARPDVPISAAAVLPPPRRWLPIAALIGIIVGAGLAVVVLGSKSKQGTDVTGFAAKGLRIYTALVIRVGPNGAGRIERLHDLVASKPFLVLRTEVQAPTGSILLIDSVDDVDEADLLVLIKPILCTGDSIYMYYYGDKDIRMSLVTATGSC